jgi:ketosteroid isomerase-like protein
MSERQPERSVTLGPNAELVRQAFERWNTEDRESLLETIDPGVEIHAASAAAFGREPYRGHDGYREWLATMADSFDHWELRPTVFHERGDTVVVLGTMHLRGRMSGVQLDQETGWVVQLREEKMWRFQAFLNHKEALDAGGIS